MTKLQFAPVHAIQVDNDDICRLRVLPRKVRTWQTIMTEVDGQTYVGEISAVEVQAVPPFHPVKRVVTMCLYNTTFTDWQELSTLTASHGRDTFASRCGTRLPHTVIVLAFEHLLYEGIEQRLPLLEAFGR